MKAGDAVKFTVRRQTSVGAAAIGLVAADFVFTYRVDNVSKTFTPSAVTEGNTIGATGDQWREYLVSGTLDATVGYHELVVTPDVATDTVWPAVPVAADLGTYDLDLIASIVVRPVVTIDQQGGPVGDLRLRVPKGDYAVITFSVTDQSGNAVDLTGDNNAIFGVENEAQTLSTPYQQTTGIALGDGTVTIAIPESATFYSELTTGNDSVTLYWSLTTDKDSNAAQTRTVAKGTLEVVRREVP